MKYLVFDAGGTFIKYAIMDEKANIYDKSKVPTPQGDFCTLNDYIDVLEEIYIKYKDQVQGIAISAPGVIDSTTGYCYSGGYLTYVSQKNPVELLEERCHVPVTIENDGKCAALAEVWKGSMQDVKNGAVIILGTGVGGGLILDGQVYKGKNFAAGEFSYVLTDRNHEKEENSYWGMVSGSNALSECVCAETGIPANTLDGIKIFEMAMNGNKGVLKGIHIFAKQLATQIYNLQAILDLERIAIGGGISQQPLLIEEIRENLNTLHKENPLRRISDFIPFPIVTNCTFFNDSNLIGALYHHIRLTKSK